MRKFDTIAEYLATLDPMQLEITQIVRELLQEAAPESHEIISYNMPAIEQNGHVLVYFAPTKKHLGFYPTADPILEFKERLMDYQTSKGTIQIPYDQPLPVKLIRDIVAYRVQQVADK
ncbi:iron chaperone [Paucilactobacillus kaifaensis]|uniref:iron chaperone n=1 Tax=Paucilactobacillus kaifaensis TaxID=2559921 RepID=UPI001CC65E4C|nr:DUF1801 domain-containing protein [Paucilactobacillus kaifaensis]